MNAVFGQNGLVLLPCFREGKPLDLLKYFREQDSSRQARELLASLSPALVHSHRGKNPQTILLPGASLPRDKPMTGVVRSFAGSLGCDRPELYDALFLCRVLVPSFFSDCLRYVIVMHKPINGKNLGISCENRKVILIASEAEPKKGWYARSCGFVFREK